MHIINKFITNLPKPVLMFFSVALSLVVGIVDLITGDYGITVVYILPIYVSSKLLGRRACIGITLLCIIELTGFVLVARKGYETFFDVVFWNAVLQSVELGITGYLIAQLTSKLRQSTK